MANRYWRGGTGTWNTTNTTNWSTTSGGAGGASVPTTSDDVFFDANSGGGVVTISGTVTCGTIDVANWSGTFSLSSAIVTVAGTNKASPQCIINFPVSAKVPSGLRFNITNSGFASPRTLIINNGSANPVDIYVTAGGSTFNLGTLYDPYINTFDATGFSGTIANRAYIKDAFTIPTAASTSSLQLYTFGNGPLTLNTNNKLLSNLTVQTSATVNLTSQLNASYIRIDRGTLNTNNNNITYGVIEFYSTLAKVLNLGSSTLNNSFTSTSEVIYVSSGTTNLTVNSVSATFNFASGVMRSLRNESALQFPLNNVNITGSSSFTSNVYGSWSINNFNSTRISGGTGTFAFNTGATFTVNNFNVTGTAAAPITMRGISSGNSWNLIQSSGTVYVDYFTLRDSQASGGAQFYAGVNSTDSGNNTGWVFNSVVAYTSGESATSALGIVSLSTDQILSVTGLSGTTALGTAIVPNNDVNVTGVSGAALVGTIPQLVVFVTGVSSTGQIGNVDVPFVADTFGVQATIYLANVAVGVAAYPTGVQASTTLGKVAVWIAVDSAQTTTWLPINTLQY